MRRIVANIARPPGLLRPKDAGPVRGSPRPRPRYTFEIGEMLQNRYMILDWTNWTFWVTALALVAFGFNLRVIYEQWHARKMRKQVRDDAREVRDLTQRLQTATERLNKANAQAPSQSR
jgi:hypothetical protein